MGMSTVPFLFFMMRTPLLLSALFVLFTCLASPRAFADTEPYWNWRNPTPQGNDYQDVAYGAGRFVAVGRSGTITTSTDGTTWTAAASDLNHGLSTIAYGNGRFVAKGYLAGTTGLLVSDDGLSWTVPNASVPSGWDTVNIITYASDRFFAISNSAFVAKIGKHTVATSTDGVNWTKSTNATEANVGRIAFGGAAYVGQNMLTGDLKSTDGVTWTFDEVTMMRSTDGDIWEAGSGTGLAAISAGPIYFKDQWVVGGTLVTTDGGTQRSYRALSTSTDGGENWTVKWNDPVNWTGGNAPLGGLAVFDGRLYLLGDHNVPIVSTTDFLSVRADVPTQIIQLNGIESASGRIVAVGRYGRIASSDNGTNWTMFGSSTVSGNLRAAAFGSGQWIAAGDSGLAASPDGITWQMLTTGGGYTEGSIAYGNGRFVAGKPNGTIGVSTDTGATWTDSNVVSVRGQVVFAQDRFVAASGLVSSSDGVTWTPAIPAPGGTGSWTGVNQIDGIFYAIGTTDPMQEKDGVIARSLDGVSWTIVATMPERLASVGGKGGLLVASGYGGEVWTSNDGVTWQQVDGRPLQSYGPAASVLWVGDSLVAVTLPGQVVTSDDAITWAKDEFASSGTMFTMVAGNGQVLAMGAGGAIWEVGAARFTLQPESRTVTDGDSVSFSVGATGKEPLSYQWLKDGTPISAGATTARYLSVKSYSINALSINGANSRTLTLSAAGAGDAGRYSVIVSNGFGSTESNTASLVVGQSATSPTITSQPESKTVESGSSATISIIATGDAPLSYQWRKDTDVIADATGSSYTIPSASATDGGSYNVIVSNGVGTVTSNSATLTVIQSATPPGISSQPEPKTVTAGTSVTFSVAAAGDAPLTYQWHKGVDAIAGATSSTYTIPTTSATDSGTYSVIVQNSAGTITSDSVTLTVTAAHLVNISMRAFATTDNGVTIGGFVIAGSDPKQVLIRAVGPTLTTFGLAASEVLADPTIELFRGTDTLAINDNWGENTNAGAITTTAVRVGATPLDAGDTNSAAMLITLDPGAYTFIARGGGNTSGIVLLEVYDTDSSGSSFANISTRAYATTGNGAAIGGFVINGNAAKKVLMRAVGPTLESYGLGQSEVLNDPTMELRQGTATLATNDDWGNSDNVEEILSAGTRIGAAPLSSSDTKSAALLKTLQPGVYSFIVKGQNDTSGLVLVEIYDAD